MVRRKAATATTRSRQQQTNPRNKRQQRVVALTTIMSLAVAAVLLSKAPRRTLGFSATRTPSASAAYAVMRRRTASSTATGSTTTGCGVDALFSLSSASSPSSATTAVQSSSRQNYHDHYRCAGGGAARRKLQRRMRASPCWRLFGSSKTPPSEATSSSNTAAPSDGSSQDADDDNNNNNNSVNSEQLTKTTAGGTAAMPSNATQELLSENMNGLASSSSSDDSNGNNNMTQSGSSRMRTTSSNNKTFDGGSILAIDPADIRIVPEPPTANNDDDDDDDVPDDAQLLRQIPFVSMFRGSANYIANHRHTVAVYHVPGGLLAGHDGATVHQETAFRDLMNDVALTWLLGMKLIIVVGCRQQIEQRLESMENAGGNSSNSDDDDDGTDSGDSAGAATATTAVVEPTHGLRVTDARTLRIAKEEAGYVRFEVERQLARSLRMQGSGGTAAATATETPKGGGGGLSSSYSSSHRSSGGSSSKSSSGYYAGNVVSGNFYSAQPFGILDGVDYQYTGFVRRVETEKIRKLHENRDICLLTTLGVSPSGEVFNVNSESLAATVAGAMEASKVVYFTETETDLRHAVHGNKIQNLRLKDACNFLRYHGLQFHRQGFVTLDETAHRDSDMARQEQQDPDTYHAQMDMLYKIGWCTEAIRAGVKRAHIISPQHGALLQELYTRDGSGTLISADLYEGIRRATVLDVSSIHSIISPLIAAGTLIDRPKAVLENDIDTYHVYTRDELIVACGQLKKFENGFAEIGCLVVNRDYRARGRGDAMLGYLERLCLMNRCTNVFVLSTQTMEWFVERGFREATVDDLPPSRQQTYNRKRASKIYLKKIASERDLDASELWWNR